MTKGKLIISIDLELAWGVWNHLTPDDLQRAEAAEREICAALFELFDRHQVPATWAIVAALLDETSAAERPGPTACWFAPDVIERLLKTTAGHEIGSHSGRHIYFDAVSTDEARVDVEFARAIHRENGLGFTSFVFPRGAAGHLDILPEVGIEVYNAADVGWVEGARRFGPRAGQAANLIDKLIPIAPQSASVERRGRLVHIGRSMLLMGRNGPRRFVLPAVTRAKMRAGLRRAQENSGIFHLWFHPSNFYFRRDEQLATLDWFLALAASEAAHGRIEIRTLGSFARPAVVAGPGHAV